MRKPWAEVASERQFAEKIQRAAAQLRELRHSRKLSQAALAKELGVTPNAVARWERSEVPIPHWVAPYQALQERVAELKRALAEKEEAHKKLHETIKTKDFELKFERATRKASGSAEKLYQRLIKAFSPVSLHAETLRIITEVYLRLGRAQTSEAVIDVEPIRHV
jgi:transcriptional regulator with XRE-family HTH domain